MRDLFHDDAKDVQPEMPGLAYLPSWIDGKTEAVLLSAIDSAPWCRGLNRRVQHYGYRYNYRARSASAADHLGPLPSWLGPLCERLCREQIFQDRPDQVIVNEYEPGQGISAHIDCLPCFGPVIVSLSLGGPVPMQFLDPLSGERREQVLAPRSLLVLTGPARSAWQHAIPARKSDIIAGVRRPRTRRVSLTFRTMRFG